MEKGGETGNAEYEREETEREGEIHEYEKKFPV